MPDNTLLITDDAARLTGLKVRSIRHNCTAGKYPGATKAADGWLIPLSSLPPSAQLHYWDTQPATQASAPLAGLPVVASAPTVIDADDLHLAYRRAPAKSKARADRLCAAVMEFEDLRAAGETKGKATACIKINHQINQVTLWRARDAVKGHPRELWAALLLPRYKGRTKEADLTGEAWDWIKANYLNTSETAAKIIIKEAKKIGKVRGWQLPSDKTIIRRLNNVPAPQWLLGRKGNEAFDATFPAAKRDFTAYSLHKQWVTDGTKCDVRCVWPDGTAARPFIVAWMDMRSRFVFGVRGALNPSQRLTAASLSSALQFVQIKPETTLFDWGSEYLAKYISGGQRPDNLKKQEGEMPGVLKRMGIKPEWARPYRGQAKPIEKFWDYIKEHLDKLPQFQGAYCGKNAASKPEDYNPKNAIPIEVYSAKLAEVVDDYNNLHKHQGDGMNWRTPAQVYGELMQAEPRKVWTRPTAEDLRLLCLEQQIRTPDNKNASIQITIEGYGVMKYWCDELAALPVSARSKKYIIFNNPDAPELPVLVYDGLRFVCEAACISKVGNKEQAAQHYINKAKFLKPHKEEFKAAKNAAPVALPAPVAAPISIQSVVIEKPAAPVALPEPSKLIELAPGVWRDSESGGIVGKGKPVKQSNEADANALEKLRRTKEQRDAERLQKRFGTA